jgi:minor fimbrial subunit
MQRIKLSSGLLFLLSCLPSLAQAYDGTVNVTGNILNNTCAVSAGSQQQTVQMGSVASKQFYQVGSSSPPQRFTIELEKCGSAASAVAVKFYGTTDSKNADLLALTTGGATGLAIALLDSKQQLIPMASASEQYPLTAGAATASLVFYAQYTATASSVSAGNANATATFTLTYA